LVTIASCDNEDTVQLTLAPQGSGVITEPAQGTTIVLNFEESQLNPALTINWTSSSFGTPTEITYDVEVAPTGTNFEAPVVAVTTSNRYVTFNIGELNNIAVSAGLTPFTEGELDIRVVSTVGTTGSLPQISETLIIFVTPFTTDSPKIAVPGMHQGWDPPSAPLLASSGFGETDYEGYLWLTTLEDSGFKFLAPNETGGFFWGNTDWGNAGDIPAADEETGVISGLLEDVADGEQNCKVEVDGYYFVQADTEALTYSTTPISWAITGEATPLGWPSGTGIPGEDHDLTYDPETRTLFIDIDLSAGGWKFRANDDWAFQFGSYDADGNLTPNGDYIFDGTPGNYRVVLDLTNPREYTFTLTPNF